MTEDELNPVQYAIIRLKDERRARVDLRILDEMYLTEDGWTVDYDDTPAELPAYRHDPYITGDGSPPEGDAFYRREG